MKEIWQFEWGVVPGHRHGKQWLGSGSQDCQGLNKRIFLNTCPNWASEKSMGIYVKRR